MDSDGKKPKPQPNSLLQRERDSRNWTLQDVADKLYAMCVKEKRESGISADTVGRWERGVCKPEAHYRAKLCDLFGKNVKQLGFTDQALSDEVPSVDDRQEGTLQVASIPHEYPSRQPATSIDANERQPIQLYLPNGLPHVVTVQIYQQNESGTSVQVDDRPHITPYLDHEGTTLPIPESEGTSVNRRDFLLETGRAALGVMGAALLERFYRALKKPSTLDDRFLNYLQFHTEDYWRDHYYASLASYDLFEYAREHFQKIVQLLEGPMLPATRTRLCSIAGGAALLMGTLLFDMADYKGSREYFGAAIKAAQESNHHTLHATGWGWASLAWTYEGNVHKALDCIQTARHLALLSDSLIVRTWLAAIDAEAQAKLQSADACRKALDEAARVEEADQAELDHYWTSYDKVQFEGYEGSCYRLLYQSEDVRTHAYISDAQRALKEALAETDPVMARLQSVFLSDLAGTYIQQREIEQACRLAQQALLANAPQSQMIVQRVLALRQDLEQWKHVQEVKNLDAHLMPLLIRSKLN